MKKFHNVFKDKQQKAELVQENRILIGFKKIYNALLEKYEAPSYYKINKKYKKVFLTELNLYWTENFGITKRGNKFLSGNSDMLNENSTIIQKKNYIKKRIVPIISETFRQTDLKWKIYDIIDEVYKEVKAHNISGIMTPENISNLILDSFSQSLSKFMGEIHYELTESAKELKNKN